MTIKVGDKVPQVGFKKMGENGPEAVAPADIWPGKTVVLFSVPGAFTPTCSAKHLPGFVEKADQVKAKGVDIIACTAVNDAFVMGAWGKAQGVEDKILMLADGAGDFIQACGLELDLNKAGLGVRGQRFVMVVKDGTVTHLAVDPPGTFELSSVEAVLAAL